MQVQWIQKRRVSWLGSVRGTLGAVPAIVLKAKQLLLQWKNTHGDAPVPDYGTTDDLNGYWSARDQAMMNAFVDYWTTLGGVPPLTKLQPEDPVTQKYVDALEAYQKNYVTFPGSSPAPGGGSSPVPTIPPVVIPGLQPTAPGTGPVRVNYTPPAAPAESTSSNLPLIIGGLIVVGVGAALFLGSGPELQENFYVGVGAAAGMGKPRKRRRKKR